MSGTTKVCVLMGGPSAEHEISLKSGRGVVSALERRGWNAQAIVVPQRLTIEEAIGFAHQAIKQSGCELAFIALHGPFGEDGAIQGVCEELGLAYTGSDVRASRLGLDKMASRMRFEQVGLWVPRWRLINLKAAEELEAIARDVQFPVVVKPTNQGSSIGVTIAHRREEFTKAVQLAARYDDRVLVEDFVRGRELTVGILADKALPVVEIRPANDFFDYAAKYTPGLTEYVVPARLDSELSQQVQAAGCLAHETLGCRHFSRADLILDQSERPVILEVNTIPGLTGMSLLPRAAACAGISYDELCERLALMALNSARPCACSTVSQFSG